MRTEVITKSSVLTIPYLLYPHQIHSQKFYVTLSKTQVIEFLKLII